MQAAHPDPRTTKARLNAQTRWHGPDDPRTIDARRDHAAAKLETYVREIVAAAPPLSERQRNRLAVLLLAGGDAA